MAKMMKHYVKPSDGRTPKETAGLLRKPGAVFRTECGLMNYTAADGSSPIDWTASAKDAESVDCGECSAILFVLNRAAKEKR